MNGKILIYSLPATIFCVMNVLLICLDIHSMFVSVCATILCLACVVKISDSRTQWLFNAACQVAILITFIIFKK